MIVYAKLTGKTFENKAEIEMLTGPSKYLYLQANGMNVSLPSDKWLEENKDNFLAIIFIGGGHESECILGFHPVQGAKSSEYNTHERLLSTVKDLVGTLKEDLVGTLKGDLLSILKNDLVNSALMNLSTIGTASAQNVSPATKTQLSNVATSLAGVETNLGKVDEKLGKIIESLDAIKELIREVNL